MQVRLLRAAFGPIVQQDRTQVYETCHSGSNPDGATLNCTYCSVETLNPKFCSRRCAATYNNKQTPKRKKLVKVCSDCGKPLSRNCYTVCRGCCAGLGDVTLSEAIYTKHHRSSAFALVRTRARTVMGKAGVTQYQNCKYSKHVEVCHKRSIASYPLTTKLSEINSIDNLMALCPNCHWEYDHGILVSGPISPLASNEMKA